MLVSGYLEAVAIKHWLPLLLGVFGSIPWWARSLFPQRIQNKIDQFLGPSGVRMAGIVCLVVSFVCANYFAWEDNQKQIGALTTKIASFANPQLKGKIDQIVSATSADNKFTQIFCILSIKNMGSPSTAEGFNLSIKNSKIDISNISPTYIPEDYKLTTNDEVFAIFHRDMALEDKAQVPIQQGASVRGWLRYVLNGVKEGDLSGKDTSLTIHFRDYLEVSHYANRILAEKPDKEIMYYPGASKPFLKMPRVD